MQLLAVRESKYCRGAYSLRTHAHTQPVRDKLHHILIRFGLAVKVLLGRDARLIHTARKQARLHVHNELAIADEVKVRRRAHLTEKARHSGADTALLKAGTRRLRLLEA